MGEEWSKTRNTVFNCCSFPSHLYLLPPASEGWGKYCFHRCLSTPPGGGDTPVLSQVTGPMSFLGGTPVPGSFPGHWSQVLSTGVPQSWLGGMYGVPLWPGLDGVHPPPPPQWQNSRAITCYAAGGMLLAFTQEDCLVWRVNACFITVRHTCVRWLTTVDGDVEILYRFTQFHKKWLSSNSSCSCGRIGYNNQVIADANFSSDVYPQRSDICIETSLKKTLSVSIIHNSLRNLTEKNR